MEKLISQADDGCPCGKMAGKLAYRVEGGGELNAALLSAELIHNVLFFVAPILFGGRTAPTAIGGGGVRAVSDASKAFKDVTDAPVLISDYAFGKGQLQGDLGVVCLPTCGRSGRGYRMLCADTQCEAWRLRRRWYAKEFASAIVLP